MTVFGFGIQGFPLIYSVSLIFIVTWYDTSGYLPTPSMRHFCPGPPFMIFCTLTWSSFRNLMLLTCNSDTSDSLLFPRLILLMVVCSQHLGSCQIPLCSWRPSSTSTHICIPVFRLLSVGRWDSGHSDVHGQVRYILGRWRQENSGVQVLLLRKFQPGLERWLSG